MSTLNPAPYRLALPKTPASSRALAELTIGFAGIIGILWIPARQQLFFGPIMLLAPLALVLWHRPTRDELGFGVRGFASSLWILAAAAGFSILSILVAQNLGTFHTLYEPDLSHIGGYVLWTLYQQFLLQDYFMPRLTRLLSGHVAVAAASVLFAVAHLPNLPLVVATLVWGAISCALFRRYRNIYVLGLAQGLLGLCFAICIPDAIHHHMRVGLGYLQYHGIEHR